MYYFIVIIDLKNIFLKKNIRKIINNNIHVLLWTIVKYSNERKVLKGFINCTKMFGFGSNSFLYRRHCCTLWSNWLEEYFLSTSDIYKQTNKQTNEQTNKQTNKKRNEQTNKQTNKIRRQSDKTKKIKRMN